MKRFGDIVVEEGLATEEQIQSALEYQTKSEILLGQIMMDMGFLTHEEKDKIFEFEKTPNGQGKKFGEISVELGFTKRENVDKALAFQKKGKGFLGDILVELGIITMQQKDRILQIQLDIMSDHNND